MILEVQDGYRQGIVGQGGSEYQIHAPKDQQHREGSNVNKV
jgi:hypothetical protein